MLMRRKRRTYSRISEEYKTLIQRLATRTKIRRKAKRTQITGPETEKSAFLLLKYGVTGLNMLMIQLDVQEKDFLCVVILSVVTC